MNDIVLSAGNHLPAEYQGMLARISQGMPAVLQGADQFYKSASQFKMFTLDNTALTPIKSLKQMLAEIERTRGALAEAHFKLEKSKIEIERKQSKLTNGGDHFDKRLLQIEITELQYTNGATENYMRGAVRKLSAQVAQYQRLLKQMGKTELTEADYEREEARYHLMTAFKQAWIAANSRGGHIDEGNLIYLFDLGVPLAEARAAIRARFEREEQLLAEGKSYSHADTVEWLSKLADLFADNPEIAAKARGLALLDVGSLNQLEHNP